MRRLAFAALPASRVGVDPRHVALLTALLTSLAAASWVVSLPEIDVGAMNDLGLVSILPPLFFVALGALTMSMCLSLRREPVHVPFVLLHVAVLVLVLYATPTLVEEAAPRTESSWKMVGIIEQIARTGDVDPHIDHFFNWPSFFIFAALVTELGGLVSPLGLAAWAPVFLNLLYLVPLIVIFRTATTDERVVWLGAWLFYLTNWVGQDYLSAQGFNYFLYLVVLAVVVKWFHSPAGREATARARLTRVRSFLRAFRSDRGATAPATSLTPTVVPQARAATAAQRAALMAVVIAIFALVASGHQLTPFATIAAVAAGVLFGRFTARGLPVVMLVIAIAWISFMTAPFLEGQIEKVSTPVGAVGENVSANLVDRVQGTPEHVAVVLVRLALTAAIWLLAFAGAVRCWRRGRPELTFVLLALSPFPLLALQEYGGELLMRAYFFSLPFVAFLAASFFYASRPAATSLRTLLAIALTSVALLGGFLVARYGNESMDAFTTEEVTAVRHLYDMAEPNSVFLAMTANVPWKHRGYATYDYELLVNEPEWEAIEGGRRGVDAVVRGAANILAEKDAPEAYLIVTRGQKVHVDLLGLAPEGSGDRFERAVMRSSAFRLIYSTEDAKIFRLSERQAKKA